MTELESWIFSRVGVQHDSSKYIHMDGCVRILVIIGSGHNRLMFIFWTIMYATCRHLPANLANRYRQYQ